MKHEILKVSDLQYFQIRELRQNVVDQLAERIKERGYNQAKCLTVVKMNDGYFVADGNHRLKVLQDNGVEFVPCVVYEGEGDIYNLAVQANVDEDTYAPMDLFDWLDCIGKLKDEGKSLKEIGVHIGWEESKAKQYSALLNKVTGILDLCKQYQIGRVTDKVTNVTFDFTEGWFRDSGLYDLTPSYQLKLIENFIRDKFNWRKAMVQSESAKYKRWQEFIQVSESKLVDANDIPKITTLIENNTFKTLNQLNNKIEDLNKEASNKLICGDAIQELEKLDDCSIDLVITDPPYGIEYSSNRSQFDEHVTKETITNDGLTEALELLDKLQCFQNKDSTGFVALTLKEIYDTGAIKKTNFSQSSYDKYKSDIESYQEHFKEEQTGA